MFYRDQIERLRTSTVVFKYPAKNPNAINKTQEVKTKLMATKQQNESKLSPLTTEGEAEK